MKLLGEDHNGQIISLEAEPFGFEVDLQNLLEKFPELVLASTTHALELDIWVIGYEVPTESGSIDLLLLDSGGGLWVIETKLAKNPEVKKQVVGQVLAYASCVADWSREKLEAVGNLYLANRRQSLTLLEFLSKELGDPAVANEVLDRASQRAQNGDLQALIVVDDISSTLTRLVEFVNSHATFELLALKLETTSLNGSRLFIPTLVGRTASGKIGKAPSGGDVLSLIGAGSPEVQEMWDRLKELAASKGWRFEMAAQSVKVTDQDGDFVVRLWPTYRSLELILSSIREGGLDEQADAIHSALSALVGKTLSVKNPSPQAKALLPCWTSFCEEILPGYVAARKEAKRLVNAAFNTAMDEKPVSQQSNAPGNTLGSL